jgi:hypothetical protein
MATIRWSAQVADDLANRSGFVARTLAGTVGTYGTVGHEWPPPDCALPFPDTDPKPPPPNAPRASFNSALRVLSPSNRATAATARSTGSSRWLG